MKAKYFAKLLNSLYLIWVLNKRESLSRISLSIARGRIHIYSKLYIYGLLNLPTLLDRCSLELGS